MAVNNYLLSKYKIASEVQTSVNASLVAAKLTVYSKIGNPNLATKSRVINQSQSLHNERARHVLKRTIVDQQEQQHKRQESMAFAQKQMEERKLRQDFRRKESEKLHQKIHQAEAESEQRLLQQNRQREESKKQRVQLLLQKKRQRRQNLTYSREFIRSSSKSNPLYKLMHERYVDKVVLPELEKQREILDEKHRKMSPIPFDEIREHTKAYSAQKNRKRPISVELSLPQSRFNELLSKERQAKRQIIAKEQEQRRLKEMLASKKLVFAQRVKSMHMPSIDPAKSKEMQLIRAKLDMPVPKKVYPSGTSFMSSKSRSKCRSVSAIRPVPSKIDSIQPQRKKTPSQAAMAFDPYDLAAIEAEEARNEELLVKVRSKMRLLIQ